MWILAAPSSLLLFLASIEAVRIKSVWTPDVIENGTQESALVDCDFAYDDKDIDSLELKWYFRYDPEPIYSWIPPAKPQVADSFKDHVNINYQISSDPYLQHRALNLQGLSTKLSGRYSCRVSSIYSDDFKSKDLIIYSPARRTSLDIGWVSPRLLNVTCEAIEVYPEPDIRILINHPLMGNKSTAAGLTDVSERASRTVVWSGGSFAARMSKTLQMEQLAITNASLTMPSVTCEFVLAKTPYREVRWQRVPPAPQEFLQQRPNGGPLSQPCSLLVGIILLVLNTFITIS